MVFPPQSSRWDNHSPRLEGCFELVMLPPKPWRLLNCFIVRRFAFFVCKESHLRSPSHSFCDPCLGRKLWMSWMAIITSACVTYRETVGLTSCFFSNSSSGAVGTDSISCRMFHPFNLRSRFVLGLIYRQKSRHG